MNAAETPVPATRADLLLEHVAALERPSRPSANERLERIVGGQLARLLVGALAARRPRHVEVD